VAEVIDAAACYQEFLCDGKNEQGKILFGDGLQTEAE
jgi:hypothetical protein